MAALQFISYRLDGKAVQMVDSPDDPESMSTAQLMARLRRAQAAEAEDGAVAEVPKISAPSAE
jgi:hypothetical protein